MKTYRIARGNLSKGWNKELEVRLNADAPLQTVAHGCPHIKSGAVANTVTIYSDKGEAVTICTDCIVEGIIAAKTGQLKSVEDGNEKAYEPTQAPPPPLPPDIKRPVDPEADIIEDEGIEPGNFHGKGNDA